MDGTRKNTMRRVGQALLIELFRRTAVDSDLAPRTFAFENVDLACYASTICSKFVTPHAGGFVFAQVYLKHLHYKRTSHVTIPLSRTPHQESMGENSILNNISTIKLFSNIAAAQTSR